MKWYQRIITSLLAVLLITTGCTAGELTQNFDYHKGQHYSNASMLSLLCEYNEEEAHSESKEDVCQIIKHSDNAVQSLSRYFELLIHNRIHQLDISFYKYPIKFSKIEIVFPSHDFW